MRRGRGEAHAAIGILNATATGIGCSLAVSGGITAEWRWTDEPGLRFGGPCDDRLAHAVFRQAGRRLCIAGGAWVRTASTFPPSRGLKTSSGAAGAMVRAAHAAADAPLPDDAALRLAVAACQEAGITLTGALDDQAAALRGGCHVTDNRAQRVLRTLPVEPWRVAVWVPDASIPKSAVAPLDATRLAATVAVPERGQVPQALTRNGAAFTRLYARHGLPVNHRPAAVALEHGAVGAGLSGTGPAVAALFEREARLPFVEGGTWSWHRAVEAAP